MCQVGLLRVVDFFGSRWMETAPTSIEVLLRQTQSQSDEPSDLRGSLSPTGSPRRSPKSKFMVFRKPQKKIKIPVIKINQNELEYVETFNFLGVNLDTNISWKSHLSKVSNKIVRIIGVMNKLLHSFMGPCK